MPETHSSLFELHNSDVVQDYLQHVNKYAGYDLPVSFKRIFDRYHTHFFTEPRPLFTKDWGPESPDWKWQRIHNEAMFDATQESVAATLYHRDRMIRIERDLLAFPDRPKLIDTLKGSGVGGGNTRMLNFEYHGFVFAYRHALDHLIRGTTSLIKHQAHTFGSAENLFKRFSDNSGLSALLAAKSRHFQTLQVFLSTGDSKSVRDMIAHRKYVKAGTLNANAQGIFLAQEGQRPDQNQPLSESLEEQIITLRDIIDSTFLGIIEENPKLIS